MQSTSQPVQRNIVSSFTNFAERIRRSDRDYQTGISEFYGLCNIFIGAGQILACPFLLKSKKLYNMHLSHGKAAVSKGAQDLIPVATIAALAITALAFHQLSQDGEVKEVILPT